MDDELILIIEWAGDVSKLVNFAFLKRYSPYHFQQNQQ